MAPLTPAMTVMKGLTFRLLFFSVVIRGPSLVCCCSRACFGYLSRQYIIYRNCYCAWEGEEVIGV